MRDKSHALGTHHFDLWQWRADSFKSTQNY